MSYVKGKVALVTGGHRGLGFHCCANLMMNGIKGLVIVGKDEKKGKQSICELETFGDGEIHFMKADVTVAQNFKSAFDATAQMFKQLDIFVNCSETIDEYSWERAVKFNLISACRGSLLAMKHYIPKYKSTDEGVIVNLASVTGIQAATSLPIYSSTKYGVVGLVRSLGSDYHYQKHKCRVMALCPGFIKEIPLFNKKEPQGIDLDLFDEETCDWPKQKSNRCAKCLIKVINEGKNGSVWVSEGEYCYEWKYPNRFELFAALAKECALG